MDRQALGWGKGFWCAVPLLSWQALLMEKANSANGQELGKGPGT